MVPTADLANHSFQCNSVYAFQASQGLFELKSSHAIKEGKAVCLSYGASKTNAELMRDYGFSVPGNPQDRLDFTVLDFAPVTEEEEPYLLAGPLLSLVGLTGQVLADGRVTLPPSLRGNSVLVISPHVSVEWSVEQWIVPTGKCCYHCAYA